jgi:hypothetical protein
VAFAFALPRKTFLLCKTESSIAPSSRPVRTKTAWTTKARPSPTLQVRESKAVGKMRKPKAPPTSGMASIMADDDDDVPYVTLQPLPHPPSDDSDEKGKSGRWCPKPRRPCPAVLCCALLCFALLWCGVEMM